MKRYILTIAIALATTLSAAAQKTIEILHTNDTHSCINIRFPVGFTPIRS